MFYLGFDQSVCNAHPHLEKGSRGQSSRHPFDGNHLALFGQKRSRVHATNEMSRNFCNERKTKEQKVQFYNNDFQLETAKVETDERTEG